MILFLFGTDNRTEADKMIETARIYAARFSEEKWEYYIKSNEDIEDFLDNTQLLDMSCVDVTMNNGVIWAKKARSINEHGFIIVVADNKMSPMEYIVPDIKVGALLIKPYSKEMMNKVLFESIQSYMTEFSDSDINRQFIIDTREGRQVIPYSTINYFEAREKKIFANIGSKEIAFYDTIDNLEKNLPDLFIRCHRSFIVSKLKIDKIYLSQNLITLMDGYNVPLSRTYKKDLKGLK